ncbi:MAG: hypothetical protein Q4C30_07180 [Bacteroidia bacterium]|nr:hypothetical protein [Bacteroidia bacterium]
MIVSIKSLVLGVLLCITSALSAQDRYPQGLYMSFDEIVNKAPSVHDTVYVIQRSHSSISMVGGNDYELESPTIKSKILKRQAYAYSDGDTLYINCIHYKAQPWYAKVYSAGEYLMFNAGMSPKSKNNNVGVVATSVAFGAIGGAIGGAKAAHARYPYVIKVDGNEFDIIGIEFFDKFVLGRTDILYEYLKEKKYAESLADKKIKKEFYKSMIEKYTPYINKQ